MYKLKVQLDIIMYIFLFGLLKMLVVIISLELLLWVLEAGGGEPGDAWLLATLVYLLKFLYVNSCVVGGRIGRNLLFFFFFFFYKSCPLYVFIHFSAAFCTAHCALDLAKDHAP